MINIKIELLNKCHWDDQIEKDEMEGTWGTQRGGDWKRIQKFGWKEILGSEEEEEENNKNVLKGIWCKNVEYIELDRDRLHWWVLVNTAMNFPNPQWRKLSLPAYHFLKKESSLSDVKMSRFCRLRLYRNKVIIKLQNTSL
jgi:hypothetical protein